MILWEFAFHTSRSWNKPEIVTHRVGDNYQKDKPYEDNTIKETVERLVFCNKTHASHIKHNKILLCSPWKNIRNIHFILHVVRKIIAIFTFEHVDIEQSGNLKKKLLQCNNMHLFWYNSWVDEWCEFYSLLKIMFKNY